VSQAVRYTLEILNKIFDKVDKKLLKDYRFYRSINGFIHLSNITQGDYRISGINKEGHLFVEFKGLRPEKLQENDIRIWTSKPNMKEYARKMKEVLEYALGKDYTVEIEDFGGELLKKASDELNSKNPEEVLLTKRLIQNVPPIFKIYSKNGKLLGKLFDNYFTLVSTEPEALWVMERIGAKVFECKKGKLRIDTTKIGAKNLEEWFKELMNWKMSKA